MQCWLAVICGYYYAENQSYSVNLAKAIVSDYSKPVGGGYNVWRTMAGNGSCGMKRGRNCWRTAWRSVSKHGWPAAENNGETYEGGVWRLAAAI